MTHRGHLPPHQRSSDTSRAAAKGVAGKTATLREQVYAFIDSCGERGATRSEVERATGMLTQSVMPRINELCGKYRKAQLPVRVVDSGERRPGDSGASQAVWIAVEFAKRAPVRDSLFDDPGDVPRPMARDPYEDV